jgi:signal transduction histidine kinase
MVPETDERIKVLLIDDDEDDYLIIRSIFANIPESPFVLSWRSDFKKAKQAITNHEYDVYLIDYHLGEHTGLELLEFAQPEKRPEPFILLTGAGDRNVERKSMKLAAADYLVKGTFNAELLSRTLHYSIQRKQAEEQRIQHLIELNRAKDEFISLASHQLRTPATGVKQYLGMVLEGFVGDLSEAQRSMLDKAYASNERQLRIVSDLLKVAQVDAGKVILRKSDVFLGGLVQDVIKEQQETIESRQQQVTFTMPNPDIAAHIDRDTIRMVIENIVDNASKYSGVSKTIRIELTETAKHIELTIADQGVGISLDGQAKLFQKFSRIDNPLSTQVGGTGLGLYWAKKIVDLHHGRIRCESVVDQGTTFIITLPKK